MELERAYYTRTLKEKDKEIANFREELDLLLQEIEEIKSKNLEKELFNGHRKASLDCNRE